MVRDVINPHHGPSVPFVHVCRKVAEAAAVCSIIEQAAKSRFGHIITPLAQHDNIYHRTGSQIPARTAPQTGRTSCGTGWQGPSRPSPVQALFTGRASCLPLEVCQPAPGLQTAGTWIRWTGLSQRRLPGRPASCLTFCGPVQETGRTCVPGGSSFPGPACRSMS